MINFIPNDPGDLRLPPRVIAPRPERPADRAGFTYHGHCAENVYQPSTQAAEFVYWQCREAALAALAAWEDVTGNPFPSWHLGKKIGLYPDAGVSLNAYYNRANLSFYHYSREDLSFLSGASTDVVAHEVGHGILDAIRPEIMESGEFELNAFAEAFGDCVAILTALLDPPSRAAVLPSLTGGNFVETTMEAMAAAVEAAPEYGPNHNAAAPRRALNEHKWQLPSSLPKLGGPADGPGRLVYTEHSFGQVFSGCFYDAIVNVFERSGEKTEADLSAAARTAGRLLARAVATAPLSALFFREVGRAMVKADEEENAAANREAIKAAFEAHNIPLGTGAMLMPIAALAGPAPKFEAAAVSLGARTKKDLLARLGAVGGRLATSALRIGGETVAQLVHTRSIPLGRLDNRLVGVVTRVSEAVLVGESGGRAAVLGALPDPTAAADEVETYVRSLLERGAIAFDGATKRAASVAADLEAAAITHSIKTVRGKRVLTRFRYACRCNRPAPPHSTRR